MPKFDVIPRVSDLEWVAMTVWVESRGEPWLSKLGVAWVICNRAATRARSIPDTVLQSWQCSGWNTGDPNRLSFDTAQTSPIWYTCYKAACAAYFNLADDPTEGADHYMNVTLVFKTTGKTPTRWDETKITAKYGGHSFAKLG